MDTTTVVAADAGKFFKDIEAREKAKKEKDKKDNEEKNSDNSEK